MTASRPVFTAILIIGLLAALVATEAQPVGKTPRVGFLAIGSPSSPYLAAFREGLRGLGYIEGQTITIDSRFADTQDGLVPLASELTRRNVDVMVVIGGTALRAARQATSTTPIVGGFSPDPVEAGWAVSLARPGGNITGMTFLSPELAGKRLEVLKEVLPGIARVAVLSNPGHGGYGQDWGELQVAARSVRVALQNLPVRGPGDLDKAFAAMNSERPDALMAVPDALTVQHRGRIAEFALRARLPTMHGWREFTDAGGLMSYGPSLRDGYQRLATFVDKILRGTAAADLPIERPTRFELVINVKTAKALGLTIPQSVLLRADDVIE
jgi:putative ABC transport system substrate-binding protein